MNTGNHPESILPQESYFTPISRESLQDTLNSFVLFLKPGEGIRFSAHQWNRGVTVSGDTINEYNYGIGEIVGSDGTVLEQTIRTLLKSGTPHDHICIIGEPGAYENKRLRIIQLNDSFPKNELPKVFSSIIAQIPRFGENQDTDPESQSYELMAQTQGKVLQDLHE